MQNTVVLIFGILAVVFGYKLYQYYEKNSTEFGENLSKLYTRAVLLIITGVLITVASVIQFFK